MTAPLLESVARAICTESLRWDEDEAAPSMLISLVDVNWPKYIPEARASIQALREPSPAMLDAFVSRALQVSVSGEGGWTQYAIGQWQQMVDAALREQP
jgi:hypothetical protein